MPNARCLTMAHPVVFKGSSLVNSAQQQMCLFQQPSFKHVKILLKIQAEQDRLLGNLPAIHTEKLTRNKECCNQLWACNLPVGDQGALERLSAKPVVGESEGVNLRIASKASLQSCFSWQLYESLSCYSPGFSSAQGAPLHGQQHLKSWHP